MNRKTAPPKVASAQVIIEFAQDNGLKIHPGQDPEKWAVLLKKKGGRCPCVPSRDHCPCEFVLEDIAQLGRCRCGLFCNDGYIEEYNRLRGRRANSDGRKSKTKVLDEALQPGVSP